MSWWSPPLVANVISGGTLDIKVGDFFAVIPTPETGASLVDWRYVAGTIVFRIKVGSTVVYKAGTLQKTGLGLQ